jgi:hypothetical protein
VACSILTVIVTGAVSLGHLFPITSLFVVGTPVEGIASLAMAAMWAAAVAVVTNTANDLATVAGDKNQVSNGNLYYFSWACFVTSIILLVNYVRSVFGVDVVGEVRNRGARVSLWAALIATSMVVAGSSSRVMSNDCPKDYAEDLHKLCARTKFGIAVGSIGIILAVAVVVMKMFMGTGLFLVEFGISAFLAVLNAFAVAYITSNSGPGAPIGNLYYFSWISFLLAGFLTTDCFGEFKGLNGDMTDSSERSNGSKNQGNDIAVEDIDDL